MEFFVPVQPATFSVTPVTPSQKSADAVQHNLQPYQVVQATIAEKGDGRVLLEMDGKQMWAQSKAEVKTGQQLNLQVTSTEPRLQLRVVPQGAEQHLLRLIHLFDHKPELGARLQQIGAQLNDQNVSQQLQQLTQQFLGQRPFPSGAELARTAIPLQEALAQLQGMPQDVRTEITALLQQFSLQTTQSGSNVLPQHPSLLLTQVLNSLVSVLQSPNSNVTSTSSTPTTNLIAQILNPLLQTGARTTSSAEGLHQIQTLLTQLDKLSAAPPPPGTGASQVETVANNAHALAAALLQALTQTLGNIQQQIATPPARELALLAQVLGLNFEGRLLNGDIEQARKSLKGMLLSLRGQEDAPVTVRESSSKLLQQLELFQLCRGRLAQEGVLFLPLPYDFLQQGYALIEEYGEEHEKEGDKTGKNLSVTLNLVLNNLGAINIHMLFEQEKLFMRISCADPQTTALVKDSRAELDTLLLPLGLQRLNIDANGKDPAVSLLQRLSPGKSVLDARV
ncbi:MAG: hypothetical protein WCS16_01245 [Desulfuromonas sp.]